jgi:nucleotide-binding universal stress UspA family protein
MILCGVDESAEAGRAALVASDLAVRLDVPVVLVHVAPEPWAPDRPHATYEERRQEREAFARAGATATVLEPILVRPAATVRRIVEFGPPQEVIRALASRLGATHILVGARGHGAVEDVLWGSTGTALARAAPCPVILVPSDLGDWPEARLEGPVVCGVDGSDGSLAAARCAGELAQRLDVRLVLAHVAEGDDPGLSADDVCERARGVVPGDDVAIERLQGRVADELLALASRTGAAALAAGSRGRGAITAAVLGSVSSTLIQRGDRPIMIVPTAAA